MNQDPTGKKSENLRFSDEKSQSQTSETNPSVSSKLRESSRYIGVHISPDIKITFFLSNGKVHGKVSNVDELVPVELPEILSHYNESSITTKVKQLLQNWHLRPTYQPEPSKKVYFRPIPWEQRTWKKQDHVLKLPDNVIWICRRNGNISYAYANTITTWNWNAGTSTVASYQTTKITAVAETDGGHLVVGDEKGNLILSDETLLTGKEESVINIILLSSDVCWVKFDDENDSLFNLRLKQAISIPTVNAQKFRVLNNGTLVTWDQNGLNTFKYDLNKEEYKALSKHPCTVIKDIRVISEANFLVVHEDGTGTLWDTRRTSWMLQKDSKYVSLVTNKIIGQTLLVLDKETLVVENSERGNIKLFFLCQPENGQEKSYSADEAGCWNIDSMILLSDGSIMYATGTTPSGVHVATRDGKIAFTSSTELLRNKKVDSLKELNDSSVAVECSQSILILKPEIRDVPENIDYRIEQFKLKLRHNPTDLKAYSELEKLYSAEEYQNTGERYQVCLSGLETAMRSGHLYEARRFYEKARKIQSTSKEPCEMFLSYLEIPLHKQLTRRIHLDLYTLTQEIKTLPNNLTNRRCKTRLLVGEGDFSFTEALIDKHQATHPNLSGAIVATELIAVHLKSDRRLDKVNNRLEDRIIHLTQRGVYVLFGIDATKIHRTFKGKRFKRIQWNCPFGKSDETAREEFKNAIPDFFRSCSQLQLSGDRVHVTLVQKSGDYWKTRQRENPIVLGSARAGYRLIRKRKFGKARYPGYVHVKTGTTQEYNAGGEEQEFIFEKSSRVLSKLTLDEALKLRDSRKKNYEISTDQPNPSSPSLEDCYFVCSTDEDSSDYYESDSDS